MDLLVCDIHVHFHSRRMCFCVGVCGVREAEVCV